MSQSSPTPRPSRHPPSTAAQSANDCAAVPANDTPSREPQDCRLPTIRVTKSLLTKLRSDAKATRRPVSRFVRQLLESGQVIVRDRVADMETRVSLQRVANNVNQIARRLHVLDHVPERLIGAIEATLVRLNRILDKLEDALDRDGA